MTSCVDKIHARIYDHLIGYIIHDRYFHNENQTSHLFRLIQYCPGIFDMNTKTQIQKYFKTLHIHKQEHDVDLRFEDNIVGCVTKQTHRS